MDRPEDVLGIINEEIRTLRGGGYTDENPSVFALLSAARLIDSLRSRAAVAIGHVGAANYDDRIENALSYMRGEIDELT